MYVLSSIGNSQLCSSVVTTVIYCPNRWVYTAYIALLVPLKYVIGGIQQMDITSPYILHTPLYQFKNTTYCTGAVINHYCM